MQFDCNVAQLWRAFAATAERHFCEHVYSPNKALRQIEPHRGTDYNYTIEQYSKMYNNQTVTQFSKAFQTPRIET